MLIKELELKNFRNFDELSLNVESSVVLLLAPNTFGKTNLLEAIYYGVTGKSFKADLEREVVKNDRDFADIMLKIENIEGECELRIFLQKGEGQSLVKKRLEVNGVSRRLFKFIGNFRSIIFSPEDLNLIIDSPSQRRKHLDIILSLMDVDYYRNITQYHKIITQRNKLLVRIREGEAKKEQLFYWNDKLLGLGLEIFEERNRAISFFTQRMRKVGEKIDKNGEGLEIIYYPSLLSVERLKNYERKEIDSGQSLIGPHRDDFAFFWKGYDLSKFGSRGEQRLGVLALKIAELNFLEKNTGERPVLLLDDIFSELDENHRSLIFSLFSAQQTIITATEKSFLPKEFLEGIQIIDLSTLIGLNGR